jgi:hypothetical protein
MIIDKEERKPYGYCTKEKCKEESLKYSNMKEFKMSSKSTYDGVIENNWLYDICSHMINGVIKNVYNYEFKTT